MPISIYPPILASAQPAFVPGDYPLGYPIYFTLQNITSFNSIGHIQIRVVDQQSNTSVIKTTNYPDGIIYKSKSEIKTKEQTNDVYYVTIDSSSLKQSWIIGRCYKIQLRFGTTDKYDSVANFATWKKDQVNNQTFSEWSTVMIIKPISKPIVKIINAGELKQDIETKTNVENSQMPIFRGSFEEDDESKEALDRYKFDLYDRQGPDGGALLDSSNWIQAITSKDCQYVFKKGLINEETYFVRFSIVTINGYETFVDYKFQVVKTYLEPLTGVTMQVLGNQNEFCRENGCLKIVLDMEDGALPLTGCFVLTRTSEKSNYGFYEEIKYFNLFEASFKQTVLFIDYTVESGIKYKYGFQYQSSRGLRSPIVEDATPCNVDFEYSYLYRDNIQLKLSLNQKISSFKHTTLASKQDTLGDIYPHLTKNGYAYYAEFPLSGTISFQMDEDQTFFAQESNGLYYKDELVLSKDKFSVSTEKRDSAISTQQDFIINSDVDKDNIFIERKFREKVETFLNDFSYKLYKSPTEGNIVVGLMNVSLTPNASLSRMIFDFSATAYEVIENTLDNLNQTGIIDIGEYGENIETQISQSFGQIAGVYDGYPPNKNIFTLIRNQEEKEVGDGKYWLQLNQLNSFWVERYPEIDLTGKIAELEATSGQDEEKKYYSNLKTAIDSYPIDGYVRLKVNGETILVAPNRYYAIEKGITSLEIVEAPYPIIINYVAQMQRVQNVNVKEVTSIDVSKVWGQISGVFTDDPNILTRYNYNYKYSLTSRIYDYNYSSDDTKPIYIIADDTNYQLYKTKNLYEIIQEETRRLVADIYNIKDGFYQDENGNWTNGVYYYHFSDITAFTIEADPFTELKIGQNEKTASTILLGPTGRYSLSPMDGLIKYIELPKAQFAIIDFKCMTSQTKME